MSERLPASRGATSLRPLVGLSELLDVEQSMLVVKDKIEVPKNEHDIPQPKELIRRVLGTIATDHYWAGHLDVHHVAWPGQRYRQIRPGDDPIGGKFRGAATQKVRLPRQLHNYIHRVTEQPTPPTHDIMRQWVLEQEQIDVLYNTIKLSSLKDKDLPFETKEAIRLSSYQSKIESMLEGELGLMPDLDTLSNMDLMEARYTLRALSRVQGYSNARKCQKKFYRRGFKLAA